MRWIIVLLADIESRRKEHRFGREGNYIVSDVSVIWDLVEVEAWGVWTLEVIGMKVEYYYSP